MSDLKVLASLDEETSVRLIDKAYAYLLDSKSVNLKKMTVNARVPFSAIYSFLRNNPQKNISRLSTLPLPEPVKTALKAKVYLMYA